MKKKMLLCLTVFSVLLGCATYAKTEVRSITYEKKVKMYTITVSGHTTATIGGCVYTFYYTLTFTWDGNHFHWPTVTNAGVTQITSNCTRSGDPCEAAVSSYSFDGSTSTLSNIVFSSNWSDIQSALNCGDEEPFGGCPGELVAAGMSTLIQDYIANN